MRSDGRRAASEIGARARLSAGAGFSGPAERGRRCGGGRGGGWASLAGNGIGIPGGGATKSSGSTRCSSNLDSRGRFRAQAKLRGCPCRRRCCRRRRRRLVDNSRRTTTCDRRGARRADHSDHNAERLCSGASFVEQLGVAWRVAEDAKGVAALAVVEAGLSEDRFDPR